jgi:predicted dehydrogenase
VRIAIVGCGFVADSYVQTLPNHPRLELAGIFDRDLNRLHRFSDCYRLSAYSSLRDVLRDPSVELIVNLTNPGSHYAVSKAALESGKHVYSEKPLATTFDHAEELVGLADKYGLLLAGAPCNLLGETAQTLWKALRENRIGTPRLAYAELDEGQLFMNYRDWVTESGAAWPFKDEFETGCTLEHAAYYLGWLTAFFGPATQIVSSLGVVADGTGKLDANYAPAFSVACIDFACGLSARVTCSNFTSVDHKFRVFGDDGILSTEDCWDYASPVHICHRVPRCWKDKHPHLAETLRMGPRIAPVRDGPFAYRKSGVRMDFARGIAELADALLERREPRLSARWSLHVTELTLAMNAGEGIRRQLRTTFRPISPMPWACQ